jgi:hypothetical protein
MLREERPDEFALREAAMRSVALFSPREFMDRFLPSPPAT